MSEDLPLTFDAFCRKRIQELQETFVTRWNVPNHQYLGNYDAELEVLNNTIKKYTDTINFFPNTEIWIEYRDYLKFHQYNPYQLDLWGNPLHV